MGRGDILRVLNRKAYCCSQVCRGEQKKSVKGAREANMYVSGGGVMAVWQQDWLESLELATQEPRASGAWHSYAQ